MPSLLPLPTVDELRQAFHDAVRGVKDKRADARAGSIYDHFAGIGAILFSRAAQRDRDLCRATYFDGATGDDETDLISLRYQVDRIEDTYGAGVGIFQRPNTTAGAGTFWQGTRIRLTSALATLGYVVASDTTIGATDTIASVPIRASDKGPGSAFEQMIEGSGVTAIIDDPLWDAGWRLAHLQCTDGTARENDDPLRVRARVERAKKRVGYAARIIAACEEAGAAHVVPYATAYPGATTDVDMNVVYVADEGYTTSQELRRACTLALEQVRVLGPYLEVRGMVVSPLTVACTARAWEQPARLNGVVLERAIRGALVDDLDGAFSYHLDALSGSVQRATSNLVQAATFSTPNADAPFIVGTPPTFPAVLTRYRVRPEDVTVSILGPS